MSNHFYYRVLCRRDLNGIESRVEFCVHIIGQDAHDAAMQMFYTVTEQYFDWRNVWVRIPRHEYEEHKRLRQVQWERMMA